MKIRKMLFMMCLILTVVVNLNLVTAAMAIDTVPLPEKQKLAKRSFVADFVTLRPNGKIFDRNKVYITPDKMRLEIMSSRGKVKTITIVRQDLNLRWILNPANKTYMQYALKQKELNNAVRKNKGTRKVKSYGKQKYRKRNTVKKRIDASIVAPNKKRKRYTKTVWFSSYYGMPVATEDMNGYRNELRNIKVAKPARGLFDIPKGYRRVNTIKKLKPRNAMKNYPKKVKK